MKKQIAIPKVQFDKTELKKTIIYKLEDADTIPSGEEPMYFDYNGLKFHVVENLYDIWGSMMTKGTEQKFTKLELFENDDFLFAYLESWAYKVTRIVVQTLK